MDGPLFNREQQQSHINTQFQSEAMNIIEHTQLSVKLCKCGVSPLNLTWASNEKWRQRRRRRRAALMVL